MPSIDQSDTTLCNCTKKSPTQVLVRPGEVETLTKATVNLALTEEEENIPAECVMETDTITLAIKGSTYSDEMQTSLKECKQHISRDMKLDIYFEFEPSNEVDQNAIKVNVMVNNVSLPLGYVPGPRICQISKAISEGHVIGTKLVVTRKYLPTISNNIYTGNLSVQSKQKFLPTDDKYYYNKPM